MWVWEAAKSKLHSTRKLGDSNINLSLPTSEEVQLETYTDFTLKSDVELKRSVMRSWAPWNACLYRDITLSVDTSSECKRGNIPHQKRLETSVPDLQSQRTSSPPLPTRQYAP